MPPMNGADVLLKVGGFVVGSQRGVNFAEQNATVDFSSKDSRAQAVDYGRYSSTVSLEHLYVPTDSGYNAIKTAARAGTKVTIIRREDGQDEESASAVITNVSGDFPDQGEAVIAVDLTVDGEWTTL